MKGGALGGGTFAGAARGARPSWDGVRAAAAFEWSLAWRRRRQRGTILLGALPLVAAAVIVVLKSLGLVLTLGSDIIPVLFATGYVAILLCIVPLVLGTALVAREAEANTLAFLLVRPLSRGSLLLGKFAGAWLVTCVLLCGSYVAAAGALLAVDGFRAAGPTLRALPGHIVVLIIGALAYGALFTLVGLLSSRPALVGLFVAFVWEQGVPHIPGVVHNFSLRHHLAGLLRGARTQAFDFLAQDPPGAAAALAWLLSCTAVFLLLSVWLFARRDYP